MPAGDYYYRFRWWLCVRTMDSLGQQVERFRSNGYLWGYADQTPRRQQTYGAEQTGADADIHLRQYPDVSALDRLEDQWGQVWSIESLTWGDNEVVCRAFMFDALEDFKADYLYDASGGLDAS